MMNNILIVNNSACKSVIVLITITISNRDSGHADENAKISTKLTIENHYHSIDVEISYQSY